MMNMAVDKSTPQIERQNSIKCSKNTRIRSLNQCHVIKILAKNCITAVLLIVTLLCRSKKFIVSATQASPLPFRNEQPDGTKTPELYVRGGPSKNSIVHVSGDNDYTVIKEEKSGAYVYAVKNKETGELMTSGVIVGMLTTDELVNVTEPEVEPSEEVQEILCGRLCEDKSEDYDIKLSFKVGDMTIFGADRKLVMNGDNNDRYNRSLRTGELLTRGTLRNLVVLMKFADHGDRKLPSVKNFNVLFNKIQGDKTFAPSGSVRDVYRESSYGAVDLLSTVVGWVKLPKKESYYADSTSGNTGKFEEALTFALDYLDKIPNLSFYMFDKDKNNFVDSVVFIHSGYAAEWGATDCEGKYLKDRIWSHKWKLKPVWVSKEGFKVRDYFTSSALWGSCDSDIARIGTISHELGHVFGLPDLYLGGSGIGSLGLMGNSWGFDGTQLYPPILSAWSKIMMDWLSPTVLKRSGKYILEPVATNPQVFKVTSGFPKNEYLLIENRQRIGFDMNLPEVGLVVYHVDEFASFYKNPGFPEQIGWPHNGNHYRVAIMQPDESYHLERGDNRGDKGDIFVEGDEIGAGNNTFPNTDSYQYGVIRKTGIRIYNISQIGKSVSFSVDLPQDGKNKLETSELKPPPLKELSTTYRGEMGSYGVMFDILAGKSAIIISSLDLHVRKNPGDRNAIIAVKVYSKEGSYIGYETQQSKWNLICSASITPADYYKRTVINENEFQAVTLDAFDTRAFYVMLDKADLRYSKGTKIGGVASYNSDLKILEGKGVFGDFGKLYSPRIFNGFVKYRVIDSSEFSIQSVVNTIEDSHELATNFDGKNGHFGNMFNILAKGGTVNVVGMDIHVRKATRVSIEIYTKRGAYQGHEKNALGWKLVCKTEVNAKGQGNPTQVPTSEFSAVRIDKGDLQAFYLTTINMKGGIRYGTSTSATPSTSDEIIEIMDGAGLEYPFGYGFSSIIYSPREFNGSIKYTTASGVLSALTKEIEKELLTTFAGENGSYGIMLDLKAKKDLILKNVDLHIRSKSQVDVKLFCKKGSFVGHEKNLRFWRELCSTSIIGKGR